MVKSIVFWTLLLLWGFISFPSNTCAQNSGLDTIPTLDNLLAELLFDPFEDDPETIIENFNILLAYEAWTQNRARDTRTFIPLAEQLDRLTEQARSEMLIGVHLAIILEEYVVMESGVLPITDTAIARLDSAASRYREIIQFGVEGTEMLYQMDADFAELMSDSLKYLRSNFKNQSITMAASEYDPRRILSNSFNTARRDYPTHVYRRSLAWWFYESISEPEKPFSD